MTTAQHPRQQSGMRLPVRVFLVMAALLGVTVVTISATMLYRNAHALQEEAQSAAIQTVELLSTQFAEIGEISLANVARTLDSALNDQMVAQARIAAHLVAAAEQTGYQPSEILVILDEIVAGTALEEIWITDETGFTYLTTLRDQEGRRFRFTFDPDPMVQPQASKFYGLLDAAGNDYITQPAQVREIDKKVFKYVGVQGIDKPRIVEVGNEIVLGEQEILIEAYTSTRADVSAVIEGILVQEMETQALMLGSLVAVMEDGGHPAASINATLEQITASSVIGAIAVTDGEGRGIYRSGNAATDGYPAPDDLATASERPAMNARTVPWPGGAQAKQVSWTRQDSAYLVHVDIPIEGASGNLLYFVYQSQADLLAQSGNLVSLWVGEPGKRAGGCGAARGDAYCRGECERLQHLWRAGAGAGCAGPGHGFRCQYCTVGPAESGTARPVGGCPCRQCRRHPDWRHRPGNQSGQYCPDAANGVCENVPHHPGATGADGGDCVCRRALADPSNRDHCRCGEGGGIRHSTRTGLHAAGP